MGYIDYLAEFADLTIEVIKNSIEDYVNYKRAQRVLQKYHHKDNFCTACGIMNERELEAMSVISDYEEIQKNKREMKSRIKNSKKTAL
jgi:predicted transcriptional regulator